MDDNGTILLLRSIHDLILGLCALKISLIVFNFILIELQHMISVKAKIGLLGENQCLKNARGFYTFSQKAHPLVESITAE